jgi:hypothetical protein
MPNQQQYDPANPQPYTAPQLPDVVTPTIQQAESKEQEFAPNIQRGPMNRLGGFAELGDNLFRGYMRGRAERTVKDAVKFKKQDDAYQYGYQVSSQNYLSVTNGGLPPDQLKQVRSGQKPAGMSDDDFKQVQQAVGAVDASYNSLMQFRGQHIPGVDDKSGKKNKKTQKETATDPLQMLTSTDPQQKMQGAYALMLKMGPGVYYQHGDQKAAQQRRDTSSMENQNEFDSAKRQHDIYALQAIPANQRTPEQQAQLTEWTTKPIQPQPGDEKLKAQDAIYKKVSEDPNYQPSESEMRVMGWQGKTQFLKGKNGELIVTSIEPDGQPSYEVLRPGEATTPQAKPIPPATTGAWQKQKDDDIAYARDLWLKGDKKEKHISYDEYMNQWQSAQDSFEGKYKNAGHAVPHIVIRDNVDKNGNWTGAGMAKNARNNPQEIPSGVMSGGKPGGGINLGKENLGLPQDAVQVQIPGHSPGWIKKDQLENFKKQYPNASVL